MSMVYVIGVAIAILAAVLLSGAVRMATIKLLRGDIRPIPGSSIPDECIEDLVQAEKFLRRNGFLFQSHVHRDATINGQRWGLYGAVYFHEESNTWALAYIEPIQHPVFSWRVYFLTSCSDDKTVCTISGGEFEGFPMPPPFMIHDSLVYLPSDQLHFHREKTGHLLSSSSPVFDLTEALDAFEIVHFQGLVDSSILVKRGGGYRLPLGYAMRVVKRYKHVLRELTKQKVAAASSGSNSAAANKPSRLANDIRSYRTYCDIKAQNTAGWLIKTGVLLASVLIFSISFGLNFSFDTVLILVAVLLIHEAGHLLGMWLFGYKDLSMLFVPFMGALANGKKEQVKAWQETIILLLGPVPGYVSGVLIIAGVFGEVPGWVYELGLMALILNLFNLLPFMPLDGGKIFNLALFSRMPRAQVVFMFVSILAFLYIGLVLEMRVVLVVAALLAIGMPFLFREAQLFRAVLRENPGQSLHNIEDLMRILDRIPAWTRIAQDQRWLILDSLRQKVQHHTTGIRASILIFAVWVFSVLGPPYFSVSADTRAQLMIVGASLFGHVPGIESVESLKKRYRNAGNNEKKADLAYQLASRLYMEDFSEVEIYLKDMKEIAESLDLPPDERAGHYLRIARVCETHEKNCAVDFLERVVDIYRANDDLSDRALSPLYNLASLSNLSYNDRVKYLGEMEVVIQETGQFSPWLSINYSLRARAEYEQENYDGAERWLLESINVATQYSDTAVNAYWKALVNYYFERGQTSKAIDAAQRWATIWTPDADAAEVLGDNPQYILAWLYSDIEPASAKEYINGIEVQSAVEKFELLLADWVIDPHLTSEDIESGLQKNKSLMRQVDEEYGWYVLNYRLELASEYEGAQDTFDSRQLLLDQYWYGKIAMLLDKSELSTIKRHMHD